jgi:hypothetical protein
VRKSIISITSLCIGAVANTRPLSLPLRSPPLHRFASTSPPLRLAASPPRRPWPSSRGACLFAHLPSSGFVTLRQVKRVGNACFHELRADPPSFPLRTALPPVRRPLVASAALPVPPSGLRRLRWKIVFSPRTMGFANRVIPHPFDPPPTVSYHRRRECCAITLDLFPATPP